MEFIIPVVVVLLLVAFGVYNNSNKRKRRRLVSIANYEFPSSLSEKVMKKYPHLSFESSELVIETLRDYFLFCARANKRMVSMPSQVVDVAWHEFILFTRRYEKFCNRAFGYFLHHTPSEAMESRTEAKDGIKRAWRLACQKEGIDPKKPKDLPVIFAIDALLNIEDGFRYALDCESPNSPYRGYEYCASHIGCGGGCGSGAGSDTVLYGTEGCGGSGCGGGCGGGGGD